MLFSERCQLYIPFKLFKFVIQHIATMSKYGRGSLNILRAYPTDILRYTPFRVSWRKMADFSAFLQIDKLNKLYFAINALSNEKVILRNPADTF